MVPHPACVVTVQVSADALLPQHLPVWQGLGEQVVPMLTNVLVLVAPQAAMVRTVHVPVEAQHAPLTWAHGSGEQEVLSPR